MSECYVRLEEGRAVIGNKFLERSIAAVSGQPSATTSFLNRVSDCDYARPGSAEFSFSANGEGLTSASFRFSRAETREGNPSELILQLQSDRPALSVRLHYQVYDEHPVLRKWMEIGNLGTETAVLADLDWEDLNLMVNSAGTAEVWADYFTRREKAAAISMDDCALLVNDVQDQEGFILATEAPGPLKRLEVYARPGRIAAGYNRDDEAIFDWRLAPGETFTTPASFILLFAGPVPQDVIDSTFAAFVEEHLTVCDVYRVPTVMVNTWEPFGTAINRELLLEQIDLAGEMGVDAYQVDDGWFELRGDWNTDTSKFPGGLEEIADYARARGMRFGLWMAVACVNVASRVCREHPEWIALDRDGQPNRHERRDEVTMCLDSGYYEVILSQIDDAITRYGVELLKLDLSAVRNLYQPGLYPGCFATNHNHRSHGESHVRIMARLFDLVRTLKERHPKCLIDVSYELYGVADGTDFGLTSVADQDWFTNISSPNEVSLRREIYQRGRVTRPWTLNFGGTRLDHPNAPYYGLFSTLTSHALFWGDLRLIDDETRAHYRRWFDWAKRERAFSDFNRYYRVSDILPVPDGISTRDYRHFVPAGRYGVPPRGVHPRAFSPIVRVLGESWDGVARLNPEGEGPIFLFRPAASGERYFFLRIPWVKRECEYLVRDETQQQDIGTFAGDVLADQGLMIVSPEVARAVVLVLRKVVSDPGPAPR